MIIVRHFFLTDLHTKRQSTDKGKSGFDQNNFKEKTAACIALLNY